ncbi:hypothetical protein ACFE04_017606 [Oxalis oulophora]
MKHSTRPSPSGYRPPTHYHYHRRPYTQQQPPPSRFPKFEIELRSPQQPISHQDLESLLSTCEHRPDHSTTTKTGASLIFTCCRHALSAFVSFWKLRLDGGPHTVMPVLSSRSLLPSDESSLRDQMKGLFADHIRRSVLEGELVENWEKKVMEKLHEIDEVTDAMKAKGSKARRFISLAKFNELNDKKAALNIEMELISKRVKEFKTAMAGLLEHIERDQAVERQFDGVELFCFDGVGDNWERVYHLILRECRRFEDGLPIYASRQDILGEIRCSQITVLIGETGSGKSTQLVQFLADSGITGEKSIVCTQPRKLAAISLAQRVIGETNGCYKENSVVCYPTYSSSRPFDSKIIYMTDHTLLQHYMEDTNLSKISCIIVDEVHERSLNTDILLALVRNLLDKRADLRLVIMSATADAKQLSDYFFGCEVIYVPGRNFPVDIQYVPCAAESTQSDVVASYVTDVMKMANEVHKTKNDGTILAFLTSQAEVEWACEHFEAPNAIALPLHGKLSWEEQFRIFQYFDGKRKVIFATNIAETSLTIPGVKFVIDSGLVKESKFEPATGMNVLKVCRVSQSSANQRAGRAGRTEPGTCYRLYTKEEFESMSPNQDPEIRRVHVGVAVLRILALGVDNVDNFDFIDAPSPKAIELATRNLIQLEAIKAKGNNVYELTSEGRCMVRLGIEPRLGKIILSCYHHRLFREGVVLAAVMANASGIFCRVGSYDDKQKADCLKVQFCHRSGDLFTLLSVYKEWESLPRDRKNKWCWENSINAKALRRCEETVKELEDSLKKELHIIITSFWCWNPHRYTEHDIQLKKIILSALSENIAMHSGYDQFGYEVALTRQNVQLHPSCSLLAFGEKPSWVVFGELLSIKSQYLVCVTAFDFDFIKDLLPPSLFNLFDMESGKLHVKVMPGYGTTLLKKFCGKFNCNRNAFVSHVREMCMDERIGIEVKVDQNEIHIFASSQVMEKVFTLVNDALENEKKWLFNECLEKCLYNGAGISPSMALLGAGAVIKHLELEKRFLTVDVFHSHANSIDDKELLLFLEEHATGNICAVHKSTFLGLHNSNNENEKWGKVTFLSPDAALRASELSGVEFCGSKLNIVPGQISFGSFPAVKAKVFWPRRQSKGFAVVKCDENDVSTMANDFCNLSIGGRTIRSDAGNKTRDSVIVTGLDKDLSESEIIDALRNATERKILDFFLIRGDAVNNPTCEACEEALLKEISPFMPRRGPHINSCRVQVFQPEARDVFMKAVITFDGRLHLEAAKALEHLEGKVLPGVECNLFRNDNGSFRVKISANGTKTVAEIRRPLEELLNGRPITDASLTPTLLRHLCSRDGINLKKSIERETGTVILFDRKSINVRIFGSPNSATLAQQKLIRGLQAYEENKQLEIHLRGINLPPDLMKRVVDKFGPGLNGLKEKFPGADFSLNVYRQVIYIHGDKELKQKVEDTVYEIAQSGDRLPRSESECAICLCEVEDGYLLEGCTHVFCRLCLIEQCESAIKNMDSFPICCAQKGCEIPILMTDLKSLLSSDRLEELFRSSLASFVALSGGVYRFCPSPDCPSVYRASGGPFMCGACYAETCTGCHLEHHPYISCEKYKEFKEDPDSSLKEWCKGKWQVKCCPSCGYTIEKTDGCNHIECKCGNHICWECLEYFRSGEDCYGHLRAIHGQIMNVIDFNE